MELTLVIHQSLRVIWRHHLPVFIYLLNPHTIIGLLRTEMVKCRERQRKGILVVVEIELFNTNQRMLENNLSIDFLTSTYMVTIHHQTYQLRIEIEAHFRMKRGHTVGIESDNMIQ